MKQPVTLQFPSIDLLLAFTRAVHLPFFELHTVQRTISAECKVEDILLARSQYGATVLEQGPSKVSEAV